MRNKNDGRIIFKAIRSGKLIFSKYSQQNRTVNKASPF